MTETGDKIKQLADEEAARAEAETPGDEDDEGADDAETPTPAPEPEPAPAPPAPGGPALSPEAFEEIERATVNYQKRVTKAFAGNPPPQCEHCGGLGFDLSYGQGAPDFPAHESFERCETCDGRGAVSTGSRVPEQAVVACPRCKGAGYLTTPPETIAQPDLVAPSVVALRTGSSGGDMSQFPAYGEPGWEPWMGGGPAEPEPVASTNAGS